MGGPVLRRTSSLHSAASKVLGPRKQLWTLPLLESISAASPPTLARILQCGKGREGKGARIVAGQSWGVAVSLLTQEPASLGPGEGQGPGTKHENQAHFPSGTRIQTLLGLEASPPMTR